MFQACQSFPKVGAPQYLVTFTVKGKELKESVGYPAAVGLHESLTGKTRGQSHLSPPSCPQQGQHREYKQGHICPPLIPLCNYVCVCVFVYIILLVSAKGLLIILS